MYVDQMSLLLWEQLGTPEKTLQPICEALFKSPIETFFKKGFCTYFSGSCEKRRKSLSVAKKLVTGFWYLKHIQGQNEAVVMVGE